MTVNVNAILKLKKDLGYRETTEILRLSKKQDTLDRKWQAKMKKYIEALTQQVLENLEQTGRLRLDFVDFVPILMEHSYDISRKGVESTEHANPVRAQRLASVAKKAVPKTYRELRIWWDAYRKKKKVPARQKILSERLRKAYVDKCQEVWKANSQEFLNGNTTSKTQATQAIVKGADVVVSRGKMIMETETTFYYNKARRDVYDGSPDVTHYLFISIRDFATTKWCKSRQGLVYAKGDSILNNETPPIHWNCRSELLPLTPANLSHRKLIEDESKNRRQNIVEPLPPEWMARVR